MYFPKNKIKTGLNSNGDLLIKSSKLPYYVPYFETYNQNNGILIMHTNNESNF